MAFSNNPFDTGGTGGGGTGPPGPPGLPATVAVGTTTTGAAGSSATVTNSGTANAAVLNFTIPAGDPGAAGVFVNTTPPASPTGGELFTTAAGKIYVYNNAAGAWVGVN